MATGRCGHPRREGLIRATPCSTPFGDGAMWTRVGCSRSPRYRDVLNAFWRRGDVDSSFGQGSLLALGGAQRLLATGRCGRSSSWLPAPERGGCSTPFGDGAMWTARNSSPRKAAFCAQRLLATGRCGRALETIPASVHEVLNAFWRRGDVDLLSIARLLGREGVLNAFWRRGDVDWPTLSRVISRTTCSTPFGDGAMWTPETG